MSNFDPAHIQTDKKIAEIERRITVEYKQAEREITKKLNDHLAKYQTKDKIWQQWVHDKKRTQEEYEKWRVGQLAVGDRWEEMRKTIAQDLMNTDKIAKSIAYGYMPEVYAINHDYGTYEIEHGSGIDTSYTLYSREAAERIFRDNPQMLPAPGKKVSDDIARGLAERWNNNHIQSVMMQAILQGNSIPDIATRLANTVGDTNRKAAIRNARTMATAAQNAGRIDSYKRANAMGIKTRKQWLATLDSRTRHEHRILDGQREEVDEPFVNRYGRIRYPGDPAAAPANVYNCRCTLIAALAGHEIDASDMSLRRNDKLKGMSYEDWKKQKRSTSRPITAQEQTGDAIREGYINEYRGQNGYVPSGRDTTLGIDAMNLQPIVQPFHSQNLESVMGKDYNDFRDKVENAPTRPLYEKYVDGVNIRRVNGGGVYKNRANVIEYDYEKNPGMDRYSTLSHECGHLFDDKIGKNGNLHFSEIDAINERCKIGSGAYKTIKECPSSSDEFLGALRKDLDNLKPKVKDRSIRGEFLKDTETTNATSGIQDALDGAFSTQKNYFLPWGHGDRYYNRAYNRRFVTFGNEKNLKEVFQELGFDASNQAKVKRLSRIYETSSEAWANVSSAVTVGGGELEAWETYMPETTNTFRKILGMVSE